MTGVELFFYVIIPPKKHWGPEMCTWSSGCRVRAPAARSGGGQNTLSSKMPTFWPKLAWPEQDWATKDWAK